MRIEKLVILFLIVISSLNISAQEAKVLTKRDFRKIEKLKVIDVPDFTLYNLKINNDLLFGINYANQEIVAFDLKKGKKTNTIGGRGDGPEEFSNIASYKIIGNNIIVLDNQSLSLKKFSIDGEFLDSKRINIPFMKGYIINESHLLLTAEDMRKEEGEYVARWTWFEYDLETNRKWSYNMENVPFFKEKNAAIKYDGNFYESADNSFVYSPVYKNGYIYIKEDQKTLNQTIDNIEPNLYASGSSRMMRNKLSSKYATAIDSEGKIIYFLTRVGTKKDDKYRAIDVYDLYSNKYLYSYKIGFVNESSPYDIIIKNNNIIVSYEENIVVYEF